MRDPGFARLAEEHGTPFYFYDVDAAIARVRTLTRALPPSVAVYYCAKANPNARVLEALRPHVAGLDVSSDGEIALAIDAGWDASTMSFAGPGKTDDALRAAVASGVGLVSVESRAELRRLARVAEDARRDVDVTLRINPLVAAKELAMKMGGGPSPFGIPEEQADDVAREALRTPRVRPRGVHVFSGTQCLEIPAIVATVRHALAIAERLARAHDLPLATVNVGGGFGVPYFAGQEDMDVEALARAVGGLFRDAAGDGGCFASTRFVLELGRWVIGPFGAYVARVVDVKEARGKRFVVLDGGMSHCFAATGNFGQIVKKNYPVRNLSKADDAPRAVQEIVGPLCTPIDTLARAMDMPRADVGDLIAFLCCGAYGYTASPLLFLGHATPPEIVRAGDRVTVARPRREARAFA